MYNGSIYIYIMVTNLRMRTLEIPPEFRYSPEVDQVRLWHSEHLRSFGTQGEQQKYPRLTEWG